MLDKILLNYKSSVLDFSETFEREFIEKNGILHTNRVVEADILNQRVHSITIVQPPEPKPLSQSLMQPLKLSVATPAMLDAIEFKDDLRKLISLLDDEVELEIRASSLSFQDVLIALGQVTGDKLGR